MLNTMDSKTSGIIEKEQATQVSTIRAPIIPKENQPSTISIPVQEVNSQKYPNISKGNVPKSNNDVNNNTNLNI